MHLASSNPNLTHDLQYLNLCIPTNRGMSRPPQNENSTVANRRGIIDFVGAPMNTAFYPVDDAYVQAGYPVMGASMSPPVGPAVYAMAPAFPPGGPAQGQPSAYVQAPYPTHIPTNTPQAYIPAYTGGAYYPYPVGATVLPDPAARPVAAQTPINEETLQQKVDSKIEAIMSAHKTDMLSQQITRLTDKVQKLSKNIEYQQCTNSLSGVSASPTDSSENEMSRRLRKLAAESSRRASPDSTPHF